MKIKCRNQKEWSGRPAAKPQLKAGPYVEVHSLIRRRLRDLSSTHTDVTSTQGSHSITHVLNKESDLKCPIPLFYTCT